jgi:adenylate cyclase
VKGKDLPVSVYESLDFHTPESFPQMRETLGAFAQGLVFYRMRQWDEAIDAFKDALTFCPDDRPSKIYVDRCRHYRDNPPGDDWDGVWVLTEK